MQCRDVRNIGAGRTPVREALQRLAMNYLVELLPGPGQGWHPPELQLQRGLGEARKQALTPPPSTGRHSAAAPATCATPPYRPGSTPGARDRGRPLTC